jgi:opacity protein-like surface antigen
MKKIGLVLALLSVLFAGAQAADFEQRQVGIRAQAMGDALIAVPTGVNSISSNPAGLAYLIEKEAFGTYTDLFGIGIAQSDLAYAQNLFGGSLGASYSKFKNTEDLFYEVSSLQVSYGKASDLLPFNWGVTLRNNSLNSLGGKADALALDLGLGGIRGSFAWGFVVNNFFAIAKPAAKADSAPREVKIGAAYFLPNTVFALELVDGKELRLGAEQSLSRNLALRAGLKDGSPTFGLGLRKDAWTIDYSFELGELGNTNSIGLTRQF